MPCTLFLHLHDKRVNQQINRILTKIALRQQVLHIFILDMRVQPLAKKGSIRIQLVVQRRLDRLYELVLHERIEYLILELIRNIGAVEGLYRATGYISTVVRPIINVWSVKRWALSDKCETVVLVLTAPQVLRVATVLIVAAVHAAGHLIIALELLHGFGVQILHSDLTVQIVEADTHARQVRQHDVVDAVRWSVRPIRNSSITLSATVRWRRIRLPPIVICFHEMRSRCHIYLYSTVLLYISNSLALFIIPAILIYTIILNLRYMTLNLYFI